MRCVGYDLGSGTSEMLVKEQTTKTIEQDLESRDR